MRHFQTTPTSAFIFYRSYSRWSQNARESWEMMVNRCVDGLAKLGKLKPEEIDLLVGEFDNSTALPSGRYMWCGGTDWSDKQANFEGSYNCAGHVVDDISVFGRIMDLSMKGSGCGAVLELDAIAKLPAIETKLNIEIVGEIGTKPKSERQSDTLSQELLGEIWINVGDSRRGWVDSYMELIRLATTDGLGDTIDVKIDLSSVRPSGERLSGFGGVANPTMLRDLYGKVAAILNGAIGRQLTSIECCLLICEAAMVVVVGNIRRSALIFQFSQHDLLARGIKDNLWAQHADGSWYMPNPALDALRMGNHTTVFHQKPTLDECIASVSKQYYSGEGAIQWAGEAVARANADLLDTQEKKHNFLHSYNLGRSNAKTYLSNMMGLCEDIENSSMFELNDRMGRYNLNPCFAAGTMVLTRDGHFPIESLIGKIVDVWDGNEWVVVDNFRVTGRNQPMVRVHLSSAESIDCTPYHRFILQDGTDKLAKDLVSGDRLRVHSQHPDGQRTGRSQNPIGVLHVAFDIENADKVYCCTIHTNNRFALSCGILVGNCGEILGSDFVCNLSEVHLNTIDPFDLDAQVSAFKAASLSVAALLHHEFEIPRYQKSRELDPIVGVSFTGLFDFFVHLFGIEWLEWWQAGRPAIWGAPTDVRCDSRLRGLVEADFIRAFHFDSLSQMFLAIEEEYLCSWRSIVADTVTEYCERHGLKVPNRYTTCQPAGSKSLLTGASPGWHPPKASRYIRRMTFGKNEPLALAAIDMGYSVIPSQSDKDENGNLLNDIHDPRVTEWLVEIPCATSWADMPGVDEIDISQFSALAQFDFYMQVQRHYSTHTTSATIELREHEIEDLATAIYQDIQSDGGYMSAALLARFDSLETFPRMPFEPISKDAYDDAIVAIRMRRVESDFDVALAKHDRGQTAESGPSGCDSDKCMMPERKAN